MIHVEPSFLTHYTIRINFNRNIFGISWHYCILILMKKAIKQKLGTAQKQI